MKEVEAAHYRLAEIAAKSAADQLRGRASKGQPKSPANAGVAVVEAWQVALERARNADPGLGLAVSAVLRDAGPVGFVVEVGTSDCARRLADLIAAGGAVTIHAAERQPATGAASATE